MKDSSAVNQVDSTMFKYKKQSPSNAHFALRKAGKKQLEIKRIKKLADNLRS